MSTLPDEIDRRLRNFGKTGDPAELWPGMTEAARVAASRELGRITTAVLAGERPVELDGNAHGQYALGIAGHTSGMGPVIGRWIEDGVVRASPEVVDRFAAHLAQGRLRAARIERELLPALDALLAKDIKPVALKGLHTSRVYFDEPGVRRMSDVDLLVEPDQVSAAEAVLTGLGYRAEGPALRPYKRDWIGPSVDPRLFSIELTDARSKWIIELHASLDRVYHPGAVARLDALRSNVHPLDVAGREVGSQSPAALLTSLACHCSQELDGVRLLRLYEIVQVVRRSPGLDWNEVVELIGRTNTARFTYPAFALANALAPATIDERVIELGLRASTWASKHTVSRLVPGGGSLDERGVLRQLMWTRGAVAIGQRLLRNVWPAAFSKPEDVVPGWRVRLARMRRGAMSFGAPDERR